MKKSVDAGGLKRHVRFVKGVALLKTSWREGCINKIKKPMTKRSMVHTENEQLGRTGRGRKKNRGKRRPNWTIQGWLLSVALSIMLCQLKKTR